MTRNDIVTRADATQIQLAPVGQVIVFENERVRVWETRARLIELKCVGDNGEDRRTEESA